MNSTKISTNHCKSQVRGLYFETCDWIDRLRETFADVTASAQRRLSVHGFLAVLESLYQRLEALVMFGSIDLGALELYQRECDYCFAVAKRHHTGRPA